MCIGAFGVIYPLNDQECFVPLSLHIALISLNRHILTPVECFHKMPFSYVIK